MQHCLERRALTCPPRLRDDVVQEVLQGIFCLQRSHPSLIVREPLLEQHFQWRLLDALRREKRWTQKHFIIGLTSEDVVAPELQDTTQWLLAGSDARGRPWLEVLRGRQLRVALALREGAAGIAQIAALAGLRSDEVRPVLRALLERITGELHPDVGVQNAEGGNGSPSPGG